MRILKIKMNRKSYIIYIYTLLKKAIICLIVLILLSSCLSFMLLIFISKFQSKPKPPKDQLFSKSNNNRTFKEIFEYQQELSRELEVQKELERLKKKTDSKEKLDDVAPPEKEEKLDDVAPPEIKEELDEEFVDVALHETDLGVQLDLMLQEILESEKKNTDSKEELDDVAPPKIEIEGQSPISIDIEGISINDKSSIETNETIRRFFIEL